MSSSFSKKHDYAPVAVTNEDPNLRSATIEEKATQTLWDPNLRLATGGEIAQTFWQKVSKVWQNFIAVATVISIIFAAISIAMSYINVVLNNHSSINCKITNSLDLPAKPINITFYPSIPKYPTGMTLQPGENVNVDAPRSFFTNDEYFCCVQDECQEYYFALSGKNAASRLINDYEIHPYRLDENGNKKREWNFYNVNDNDSQVYKCPECNPYTTCPRKEDPNFESRCKPPAE